MKKYLYTGVQTAIAVPKSADGEEVVDVALIPHEQVELPEDMPYVQRLVAKGLLTAVTESSIEEKKSVSKESK